jgi:hypothetical protein
MVVSSAQELAHALNDRLKLGLSPRPWNLYSPAETFWWLVPSSEWPAYRYGKLAFSHARDVPRKHLIGINDRLLTLDHIFAGFNVEKGYGPSAITVDPSLRRRAAQLIAPHWLWHEITGTSGAERFGRTLATAAARADVYAYVNAYNVRDPTDDHGGEADSVMFRCRTTGLVKELDNRYPLDILRDAGAATTFPELAAHLLAVGDFHWVDVYVGTHVPKGDVDLARLFGDVLSSFEHWLR